MKDLRSELGEAKKGAAGWLSRPFPYVKDVKQAILEQPFVSGCLGFHVGVVFSVLEDFESTSWN